MSELTCPRCGSRTRQVKAGVKGERQQYKCGVCRRRYVIDRNKRGARGYPPSLRDQAAALREKGHTLKEIGDALGVTARTLQNWFNASRSHQTQTEHNEPSTPTPLFNVAIDDSTQSQAKRRVTIQDVAARAGVALSTVSNYLTGKGRMSDATRSRIKAAVDTLHFTPSGLARGIRQRRTRILGVQTFGLWDLDEGVGYSIIPPILTGINRTADRAGQEILLYTSGFKSDHYGGTRFLDGHIDGLIWVAPALIEPVFDYTAEAGLPIVAVLTRHVAPNVGYVNADNLGGMRAIVEHLIAIGRRRIGYYGPLYASDYVDRYRAFCDTMNNAGLPWDAAPMDYAIGPGGAWDPSKFEQGLNRLISMADTLDAVIVSTDQMAAQAIEKLHERGYRVPDDIAVVGFNDVPNAASAFGGITTVRQPFREMGQLAVERLLALIDGAPASECRVTLPTELIVRQSTAASATSLSHYANHS